MTNEQQVQQATPAVAPATPPVAEPIAQQQVQSIPYSRFAEVVAEKNATKTQLQAMEQKLQQMANVISGGQQGSLPQFQTAEELVAYVNKQVDDKLEAAKKEYIEPIQQRDKLMTYNSIVEGYFSQRQEAAQIRHQMDAYTATLPQEEKSLLQEMIVGQGLRGRTDALDWIYSVVASQNQNQIQQATEESRQTQANQAFSPQPYRVMRQVEPTTQESIAQAIQKNRLKPDFSGVFARHIPSQ